MAHRDVLDALLHDYTTRAEAIRRDLGRSHSADFAEQAQQRQNDEVLEALLAEAEQGLLLVHRRRVWPRCRWPNTACVVPKIGRVTATRRPG